MMFEANTRRGAQQRKPGAPIAHRRAPKLDRLRGALDLLQNLEPRLLLCDHVHDGTMAVTFWTLPGDPAATTGILATRPSITPFQAAGGIAVGASPGPVVNAAPAGASPAYSTAANGLPILDSLPGAATAVYLDFDGDTGSGTTAYDEDGDPTTYNATEQANIVEAWRQIAGYYAMFDTDVTTALPTVPKAWDIIGNNAGGATGGYAYVGTFPNSGPQAFNTSSNARTRTSGMAHEVGHVFGLSHQSTYDHWGTKTAEYASAPDTLHGPIMGVDYSGSVHKWFIGHASGSASTLQDDIAVIAGKIKAKESAGGDGMRADDFAGTIAAATPLTVTGASQTASGVLERMSDVDAFSFISSGGTYGITATPPSPSAADLKLEIYSADGTLIAASDNSSNGQQIAVSLPAGTFYAQVSSHGNYGDLGQYDIGVRALPADWGSVDINPTTNWGYSEYDASTGIYTNAGSGADVWGTADSFHFAYRQLVGDGTIVTRVTGVQATDGWAKVGLDIRETLDAGSKHASMMATSANGSSYQYRTSTSGSSSSVSTAVSAFTPVWLKLVRTGNVIAGYTSPDGSTWTKLTQQTISMASTVYVGLLTCAHNSGKLNVATMDNVSITGAAPAAATFNALPAPQNVVLTLPAAGTAVNVAWDAVAGATGYAVSRSVDGINFSQIGTTTSAVTTYADALTAGSRRYFYQISATDGTGSSIPSAMGNIINRPTAPTGLSITAISNTSLVINWKDTDGETGYRVERSTDGVTYTTVTTVAANVPAYTNTGLTSATSYTYRIVPLTAAGDGATASITDVTRLPMTTGQAFDAIAATSITLHWSAVAGATGYTIQRSADNSTWTTAGTTDAATQTFTNTGLTKLTEYFYRVVATAGANLGVYPSAIFAATADVNPLPTGWAMADIGSVGGIGSAGVSGGTYTLIGGGADIWNGADAFRYVYQPLVGDGFLIARVATIESTNAWAKIGVMIRESTAAGARNAFMAISQANGATFQSRSSTNGSSVSTVTAGLVAPYWVKIARAGNVFTGSVSADGSSWTVIGSVTLSGMSSSALIGFADTAHNNAVLNTSTFDNVTLSNVTPTIATAAKATPSPVTGTTTALSVLGADDHGEANLTYSWAVTSMPAGATAPTFSANGTNAAKAATATFFKVGVYQFTVTVTDLSGLATTSIVSVTVNPTATTLAVAPSPAYVGTSASTTLSATAFDQFGVAMASQPTITWSVTAGGGSITSGGVFNAPASAQASTVKAAVGSVFSTATVNTIVPPAASNPVYAIDHGSNIVQFTFSRDVSASLAGAGGLAALGLTNLTTSENVAIASVSYNAATNTATFILPPAAGNGNYHAILRASSVADAQGVKMAADVPFDFFILRGDIDRDRTVGLNDLLILSNNYALSTGMSNATGDLDGDGGVGLNDLLILANGYGMSLSVPAAPVPAAAPTPAESVAPVASSATTPVVATATPVVTTTAGVLVAPVQTGKPVGALNSKATNRPPKAMPPTPPARPVVAAPPVGRAKSASGAAVIAPVVAPAVFGAARIRNRELFN